MIKKLLLLFISAFLFSQANAQKETDQWFFGVLSHLDFTSGTPVASAGVLNTPEGSSSMASAAGNRMFYTDGLNVYDASGTLMPNGTGLLGDISSTQAALIVPSPSVNS